MKWSFSISGYPYQELGSDLALKVSIDTKDVVKGLNTTLPSEVDASEDGVELADGAIAGWIKEVNITGCTSGTADVVHTGFKVGQYSADTDSGSYTDLSDTVSAALTATREFVYFSFVTGIFTIKFAVKLLNEQEQILLCKIYIKLL